MLTTEVNHALLVRLASEFQGYCRDLHDEAIGVVIDARLPSDQRLAGLFRASMTSGRKLDTGNANWGNLCSDFARFGLSLKDDLKVKYPKAAKDWLQVLQRLNDARNSIAHQDRTKIAQCHALEPLTLSTFRRWRRVVSTMALGLDDVVGRYLTDLNNGVKPW